MISKEEDTESDIMARALLIAQSTMERQKQRLDLARKIGVLVLSFEGNPFEYEEFSKILDEKLTNDFDRTAFKLEVLAENDPRRPKKRGRKKAE